MYDFIEERLIFQILLLFQPCKLICQRQKRTLRSSSSMLAFRMQA
jgi:hypothetical protein